MYLVGMGSFYVGYVTIPLVYLIIALGLNLVYTLNWPLEMLIKNSLGKHNRIRYARFAFLAYLLLSSLIVFGIAFSLFFLR